MELSNSIPGELISNSSSSGVFVDLFDNSNWTGIESREALCLGQLLSTFIILTSARCVSSFTSTLHHISIRPLTDPVNTNQLEHPNQNVSPAQKILIHGQHELTRLTSLKVEKIFIHPGNQYKSKTRTRTKIRKSKVN